MIDNTLATNPIHAGINKSLADEVGAGRGNVNVVGSSAYIMSSSERCCGAAAAAHWICFIRFLALATAPSMSPSKIAVLTISIHGLESSFDMSLKWNVQGVWAMASASAVLINLGSAAKYLFCVRSVRDGKLPVRA